ncbi:CinA family nicotinamide mononucleotide deamidase-related protein [Muribaculaceae bacterium Isolate-002 (NCI)]|nr:CinA family nicotinamide mononucleotide deamidase-related protein [Muribaculaceae bacterium Isolate-002 (NCI)]
MKTAVIAIGDELLLGQVIDTNSGAIARMIDPAGWSLEWVKVIHDDAEAITSAVDEAFRAADVVLTTGGLGPTKDDITKLTLCRYFGGELRHDETVLDNIKEVFAKRGIQLNPLTEAQALVPTSCRVIQNRVGTAPIMWFERTDGKVLVSMPGVPFETLQMFQSEVFPQLLKKYHSDTHISHRCVIVEGLTESKVAMQLDEWEEALPDFVHLAYLPKPGIIRLRLDGHNTDRALLESTLDRLHAQLCNRFADHLLADSDMTPEESLLQRLRAKGLTVATAESCTGGNIAHRITAIAGCSDCYFGSVVSYDNSVKTNLLNVDPAAIETHGAVSEEVASQMAEGVRKAIGTDCAIATSGIAGPSGATPGKPVGTVCIAIATPERTVAATYHFPGTRDRVIDRASTTALTLLAMALR